MLDLNDKNKKIMLTGLQPTGVITLGNYIGAIKQMVENQEKYNSIIFIADMHAITVPIDSEELAKNIKQLIALYIACGVDPDKNIIFLQSDNEYHANVSWMLECNTYYGELSRMTQFKDKSAKHEDNVNAGLFTYPVLMAADILLYDAKYVPTGIDQKQHVEICRNIAQRFNSIYGDVFRIPEPLIAKTGARIYGLTTPEAKMSKSVPDGCVFLMDSEDDIRRKFKRAVTDSDRENCVRYDKDAKPGVANLMNIYSTLTRKSLPEIEAEFRGQGYGVFKPAVGEVVADTLRPIREEAARLIKDKAYLEEVYRKGAEAASYVADKTLRKVYRKVGFYQL